MTLRGSRALALALARAGVSGCLQVEERPPSGALVVQLTSEGLDEQGALPTDDGWTLTLERAMLTLGEVRLMGEFCNPYSETQYLRVLDLRQTGPQRVVLSYALGECEPGFLVRTPASDAVLGAGVDEATRSFLRQPGTDPFVEDEGIALHVEGTAQKDAASVHFAWSFRQAFDYSCPRLTFEAEVTQTIELSAHLAGLFDPSGDGTGAARFDAIAAADTDGDAEVTLQELALAPPVAGGGSFSSLGEQLYFGAVPEVLAVPPPGRCEVRRFDERGPQNEDR
jgi:hypothetical protein